MEIYDKVLVNIWHFVGHINLIIVYVFVIFIIPKYNIDFYVLYSRYVVVIDNLNRIAIF